MNNEKKDCVPGTVYPTQISFKFEDRIKPFFFRYARNQKAHQSTTLSKIIIAKGSFPIK